MKISKAAQARIGKTAVEIFKEVAFCPLSKTHAGPHSQLEFYEVQGDLVAQCLNCGCTLHLLDVLRGIIPEYAGKCEVG